MPYKRPDDVARAAYRAVTGRVARGYWPFAHARESAGGLNAGFWILELTIKSDHQTKPSDGTGYAFEFRCDSKETATAAVDRLHELFYGEGEAIRKR